MSKWNGVVTDAGKKLLAGWVNERKLILTAVRTGTGVVNASQLMPSTDLVERRQEMSVISTEETPEGRQIRAQITAPDEGYTLNQIGFWAKLDDGEETLIAIYQHTDGIPIPSKEDAPQFFYTFYGTIAVNNEGTLIIHVDPTSAVPRGDFDAAVRQHKIDLENVQGQLSLIWDMMLNNRGIATFSSTDDDTDYLVDDDGSPLLADWSLNGQGGYTGGTMDYEKLENLPSINGTTLVGDRSFDDLGLHMATEEQIKDAVDQNDPLLPGKRAEGKESTYVISSPKDLKDLSDYVNSGKDCSGLTFELTQNIAIPEGFVPIGKAYFSGADKAELPFSGTFSGNGHSIYGLDVDTTGDLSAESGSDTQKDALNNYEHNKGNYEAAGLFGYVKGGTVENVTLASPRVKGVNAEGALVGRLEGGTVRNVSIKNPQVSGIYENAGGLIGRAGGTFRVIGCTVNGGTVQITPTDSSRNGAGGLIGRTEPGSTPTVTGNIVNGTAVKAFRKAAGLIGYLLTPTLATLSKNKVDDVMVSIATGAQNALGGAYYGILFAEVQGSPNTQRAFETGFDGQIVVKDNANDAVVKTVSMDSYPYSCVANSSTLSITYIA